MPVLGVIDPRTVAREVVDGFREHRLLVYASAIAFRWVTLLVPFLCLLLALAGVLNAESLWRDDVEPWLEDQVSLAVFQVIRESVERILSEGQAFWLTVGLVLVIHEVAAAMRVTMRALDAIYGTRKQRPLRNLVVRSVWLGAAVLALVLGALAVLALGPLAIGSGALSLLVRVPLAAALLLLAVGLIVRWAPLKPRPLGWVSFGSGLSVALWLAMGSAYAFYATTIASYGSVFGSLAVIFVFTIFMYLSAIAFLVGVLVDASVREAHSTSGTRRR